MADANQDTKRTSFQVPEEMRTFAEQSLTQARQALDGYLGAARRTAETVGQTTDRVQAGAKDLAQKALSSAEQNLRTTLDYAERLVRAKDLQGAAQVQSAYVRTQVEVMQAQMKEFGSAAQSAMGRASDQAGTTDKTKGRGKA